MSGRSRIRLSWTLRKLKQDRVVGGEEVVGEVLAQSAGRCAAALALFTPATKTSGRFLVSSPIPWAWILPAVFLQSLQKIAAPAPAPAQCLEGYFPKRYENGILRHTNGCFCQTAGECSIFVALYSNEEKCFWSVVAPRASPMWTSNVADGWVELTEATRQTASVASGWEQ